MGEDLELAEEFKSLIFKRYSSRSSLRMTDSKLWPADHGPIMDRFLFRMAGIAAGTLSVPPMGVVERPSGQTSLHTK